MTRATFNLNEDNYDLLSSSTIFDNSKIYIDFPIGGLYPISIEESELSRIMENMGDDEDYKYLKSYLQTVGNEQFGW